MRILIKLLTLMMLSTSAVAQPACGTKRYCKEMATCAEAHHYYRQCGLTRLDRDRDGIPCEKVCGKSIAQMNRRISAQPFNVASSLINAQATAGKFQCGSKRYCSEMLTCAEARFHLTRCGLLSLDGNRDGIPCNGLCRR